MAQLDPDILEGCRRGDPEAQRGLFERYRDRVHSIAVHYLRGDETAAKDVSQEVFVKVFRALPSFRQEARFSTWLYTVTRRVAINRGPYEVRRRAQSLEDDSMPEPVDADKADATYENGMLVVSLPHAAEAKPRTIKVS